MTKGLRDFLRRSRNIGDSEHIRSTAETACSYKTLDKASNEIRLLRILPSHDHRRLLRILPSHDHRKRLSPTCIALETFSLESAPDFTALSYEWGSSNELHTIFVGRGIKASTLMIRRNLNNFVSTFRTMEDEEGTWLWIDQISINQACMDERNHQVSIMHKIFATADRVIAWPGSFDEADGQFLFDIWSHYYAERAWPWQNHRDIKSVARRDYALRVIAELEERPYWRRHWILQELCLAKELILARNPCVLLGRNLIPLLIIEYLRSHQFGFNLDTKCFMWKVLDVMYGSGYFTDQQNLFRWKRAMELSYNSLCTNPRDKVFGVQSIFSDHFRIRVDYALTIEGVFRNAAVTYFELAHDMVFDVGIEELVDGACCLAVGMNLRPHHPALVVDHNHCCKIYQPCAFLASKLAEARDLLATQPASKDERREMFDAAITVWLHLANEENGNEPIKGIAISRSSSGDIEEIIEASDVIEDQGSSRHSRRQFNIVNPWKWMNAFRRCVRRLRR